MKQSLLFNRTRKNISKDVHSTSHELLVRGDFIEKTISGVYRFLPLGFRVLQKLKNIIREEMTAIGSQEILLPTLQKKDLWEETGRWKEYDPPIFQFEDIHGSEIGLGPTHEEEVTDIVRKRVFSYQDLPFSLFQIQNKFRNELRATGGLMRTREFIMKDLYSFHAEKKDLVDFYEKVKKAYFKIFKRCGLNVIAVQADSGSIGGDYSNEFMLVSEVGEDTIKICDKCGVGVNIEKENLLKCPQCAKELQEKKSIEIGHVFILEDEYSKKMEANYTDQDGNKKPILMGCYGIGVSRLMAVVVEGSHDENGIIWPKEVSPFEIHLIGLGSNKEVQKKAEEIYNDLKESNFNVLFDDRDKSPGEKFAESDLIGIPIRIVVSEKTCQKNSVGLKKRIEKEEKLVKISKLKEFLKKC